MSKINELRKIAQTHGDSAVKMGQKLTIDDIQNEHLHIVRCDWSKAIVKDENGKPITDENGEAVEKAYPIVVFAEHPEAYYAGGDALNMTVSEWRDAYGGDMDALNADLEAEGGIAVAFQKQKKPNGRTYVAMFVFSD